VPSNVAAVDEELESLGQNPLSSLELDRAAVSSIFVSLTNEFGTCYSLEDIGYFDSLTDCPSLPQNFSLERDAYRRSLGESEFIEFLYLDF